MLLNQSATPGSFGAKTDFAVTANDRPTTIGTADLNGDGLPDVLVGNGNALGAGVLLNTGGGTLGTYYPATTFPGQAVKVAPGDFNHDGLLDLAVAGQSGNFVGLFQGRAVPAITSLSPASGPVGTRVTIAGTGFLTGATVRFNGVAATGVTVSSSTSLTATVPTGATTGNVTVTTAGGTSNGLVFTVTVVSATSTGLAQQLSVYPNPTTDGQVQLVCPAAWGGLQVQVLNSIGQTVQTTRLSAGEQTLSVQQLPAGVYSLRLTTQDGQTLTKRLVRQ